MIRRRSRFFTCPPCRTSKDSRVARPQIFADKSLWLKILPVARLGSRFCRPFPVFSRFYEQQGEGGTPLLPDQHAQEIPLLRIHQNGAVPEGTQVPFPLLPSASALGYGCSALRAGFCCPPDIHFRRRFTNQALPQNFITKPTSISGRRYHSKLVSVTGGRS